VFQIKTFDGANDEQINKWLQENDVEVVSINNEPIVDYYGYPSEPKVCNQWIRTTLLYKIKALVGGEEMKEIVQSKMITFFMDESDIDELAIPVQHGYYETLKSIESEELEIYTTQMSLLHTSLFTRGYRIFIRERNDDLFEITLGDCSRTNREIRLSHNLEKMLLSGVFSNGNHTIK
jgi:hypothetical protein